MSRKRTPDHDNLSLSTGAAIDRVASWIYRVVLRRPVITQAGGIVVRRDKGEALVLIVTARRRRKRWVLPKGTVKRGESPKIAALREVKEEAGVSGKVLGLAGTAEYSTRTGRTRVDYYLIEYTRPTAKGPDEKRDVKWCSVEDAIQKLTYASARRVLLAANAKIVAHVRESTRES